jgi:hypothetical protein
MRIDLPAASNRRTQPRKSFTWTKTRPNARPIEASECIGAPAMGPTTSRPSHALSTPFFPDDGVIMHRDAEHPQNWRDQLGQVHVR